MSQLFESILYYNGLNNLSYHEARMARAFLKNFKKEKRFKLNDIIQVPNLKADTKYKCRIVYREKIESIKFSLYTPHKISSVKFIEDDELFYNHKFTNREMLDQHKASCKRYEEAIIIRKGLIRDSTWSNLAFWNGKEWHTPTYPLLLGTRRAQLISDGKIISKKIKLQHLSQYSKICFISAMSDLGECVVEINP